jgi:glutamate synthase (ferredoxin)
MEMICLEALTKADFTDLQHLIRKHYDYTDSDKAEQILGDWDKLKTHFIKVIPTDYKKALERIEREKLEKEQITTV